MERRYQRITVIRSERPIKKGVNEELRWLGSSLGLFGLRDKDSSCFRIFIELIKSSRENEPVSSDILAYKLSLTRGTVVHHLNRLMETGLVVSARNRYMLRVGSLKVLVEEIEEDIDRAMGELKKVADAIDKELGI